MHVKNGLGLENRTVTFYPASRGTADTRLTVH